MKKLLFLTLIFSLLSFLPCFAESHRTELDMPVYLGETEVNEVTEYDPDKKISLFSSSAVPDWLKNGGRNYYNYIGTTENGDLYQDLYDKLYKGLEIFAYDRYGNLYYYSPDEVYYLCIDISEYYGSLEGNQMFNTYFALLQDNPQIFYYGSTVRIFTTGSNAFFAMAVDNDYINGNDRITEADSITEGVLEYDEIINANMSNYAIEKKIHDKLILDNNYAYDENGDPSDAKYAHSIAGSLNNTYGGGVCESYAKTLQLLLNRYGVDNYFVCGYAGSEAHAWNMVRLDNGSYYCTDATWNDPSTSSGRHILYYRYFNMPYSEFYSNRNNSLTYFSEALPVCAEDTAYYTASYNTRVGYAENGDEVYQAPDVSEDETRITATTTESTTETTTIHTSTEGQTEVTTNFLQVIASDSVKPITISKLGSWQYGIFSNTGGYFAITTQNDSEIQVTVDEDCYIDFHIQFSGTGRLSVYIDDRLVSQYTQTTSAGIRVDKGMHKVRWVFDDLSSGGILSNICAYSLGDADFDGKVDITDAIYLVSNTTTEPNNIKYLDMDNDGRIGDADIAAIIRKAAGLTY